MAAKILVADKSVTAQNLGRKILVDAGYDVIAVSSGPAAVKKIAEHKPDIIILDASLHTDLDACEKIRASVETFHIPLLLTVDAVEPCLPANYIKADAIILKPVKGPNLIKIIKQLKDGIDRIHPWVFNASKIPSDSDLHLKKMEYDLARAIAGTPDVLSAVQEETVARNYIINRYQTLINRKYTNGLSPNENEELENLKVTLDDMDEPHYDAIIKRLRTLVEQGVLIT